MVLRPGRPQRRPRSVQHVVGPLAQDADRLTLDVLGLVEVDLPAALACEVGQHLAMASGKSNGQARNDIDTMGSGSAAASSSSDADVPCLAEARTRATSAAAAASSRGLPSWWIGAVAMPGSISSIRRRSTTR